MASRVHTCSCLMPVPQLPLPSPRLSPPSPDRSFINWCFSGSFTRSEWRGAAVVGGRMHHLRAARQWNCALCEW